MKIDNWLEGHWALILGASSGFGAEVSRKLSEYGDNILGIHLDRKNTMKNGSEDFPIPGISVDIPDIASGGVYVRQRFF